jgi:hypothetical protein
VKAVLTSLDDAIHRALSIACVAQEWTRLHAEARRLKYERNACRCDFEGQRDHGTRVEPCFKNFCIERAANRRLQALCRVAK